MRPLTASLSTLANLQILEEVLYDLPPLEGVFLHWHTYGVTSITAGLSSLFTRRKQLLGPTTLSGASIQLLYECATDSLRRLNLPLQDLHSSWDRRPLHARLLRHGPSLSAAETQALLPPEVLVQKTVSMTLADTLLLCTGAGTRRVTRQQLRTLSAALELPRRSIKQCRVNATNSNPVEFFAMQPGMVSPFLQPTRDNTLGALVLLPWPKRWEAQEREVAISLSLWESLVLPLRCLRPLIHSYAKRAYPGVRVIELESEDASMRIPSSRVVTCFLLFLLWNQLKEIAYLGERTTMQMPHAARFCSRWSSKERCLLPTSTFKEGIAYSADLIRLLFAPTMLYRNLVTDYRQREERQLCQT